MLKNAVLNSQMSTNHMVCVTHNVLLIIFLIFIWLRGHFFSNFQPSWTFAKLRVNRVQPWRSPLDCDLKSFEILFLDFVNSLTGFVSVYLHLSVGQLMTRASRSSWNDLKRLQDRLTFRLTSSADLWHDLETTSKWPLNDLYYYLCLFSEEVNDPPIHIEGVKCQDPVFFYFCKNRCDNTTSSVKPNARVVWFDCKDELAKGYLPSNMLSLETCDDSVGQKSLVKGVWVHNMPRLNITYVNSVLA